MADESSFLLPLLRELTFGVDAWKKPVKVVAASSITLTGLQTVDGVLLGAGDEVVCVAQSSGAQNGIWVAAAGAWTRRFDATNSERLFAGVRVPVTHGTHAGDVYRLATTGKINVGITAQTWELDSQGGDEVAPEVSIVGSADIAVTESPAGTFTLTDTRRREILWTKPADGGPNTAIDDFPISAPFGVYAKFVGAKYISLNTVTADDTNYVRFYARVVSSLTGELVTIAAGAITTSTGAFAVGSVPGRAPTEMINADGIELVPMSPNYYLSFHMEKVGPSGVETSGGLVIVEWEPWIGDLE